MIRIAVLTGGSTPERDVAFAGAAQVVGALRGIGHSVTVIDTTAGELSPTDETRLLVPSVGRAPPTTATLASLARKELGPRLVDLPAVRAADVIFPILHGLPGEGGVLQALLELAGLPYAGSRPLGSALAMDKDIAKRLFRDADIPTAAWTMWPAHDAAVRAIGFPLVVKPVKVGSTVGLTVVRGPDQLREAVDVAGRYDDEVMIEAFIPGREFTVGVLGQQPLAVGEIIPAHEIFDYECKYTPGLTREVFPADISPALAARLQALALQVHRVLKLRDFSRVDFRVTPDGIPMCLEANTLPGFTGTSLLPQSAAAVGIPFPALCDAICRAVLAREGQGNKLPS